MNSKAQLLLLFVLLATVSITAFSYFSNSDDQVVIVGDEVPEEIEIIEESTTTIQSVEQFTYPQESLNDFINKIYKENITNCSTAIALAESSANCLKSTYEANLIIIQEQDIFKNDATNAKEYLVDNKEILSQNDINKLLEIIEYKTVIDNLERETLLLSSLYEERFQSSIQRTAIFATNEEIAKAQVISYNFLKSGCINRDLVNSEEEWIYPSEVFEVDETKINFALKIESKLSIGPDCIGKLISSILNDSRGWTNITNKEFLLVDGADADFTFIFASPDKTDELCSPLETNGIYSCRNEERVVINFFRWENGAIDFGTDMKTYRLYLINHETGHILGWNHTGCPKDSALAPVMMQQSKTTDGCVPYGWPLYEIIDMKYDLDTYVSVEED